MGSRPYDASPVRSPRRAGQETRHINQYAPPKGATFIMNTASLETEMDLLVSAKTHELLPVEEIEQRTRDILARAELLASLPAPLRRSTFIPPTENSPTLFGPIDLTAYLEHRGYEGVRLMRVSVEFGREVAKAFVMAHGDYPPKTELKVPGIARPIIVNHYEGEADLALINEVFATKMTAIELDVFGPVSA